MARKPAGGGFFLDALVKAVVARGGSVSDLARLSEHAQFIDSLAELIMELRELIICEPRAGEIRFGQRLVDPELGTVRWPEHIEYLAPMERRLLLCLLAAQGRPVSVLELMTKVWGRRVGKANVLMTVKRLRVRLDDRSRRWIVSVHGQGYAVSLDY